MMIKKQTIDVMSEFVSKDEARPLLTGLNFKNGLVEATDGYILGWLKQKTDLEAVLPAKELKTTAKYTTKSIDFVCADKIKDSEEVELVTPGLTTKIKPLVGDYPDTDAVVKPCKDRENIGIVINPKLMMRLCNAFIKAGDNAVKLYINPGKDGFSLTPIIAIGSELQAIIMPVRAREE
jgi:hypothetical protein